MSHAGVRGSSGRSHSGRRGPLGQALVETALVLPVFFLILFGVIDGGRFVYTDSVMSQAAREGARLAAVEAHWLGKTTADDPSCVATPAAINPTVNPGAHVCPATPANLLTDVTAAVNRMTAGVGAISQVHIRCNAAGSPPTGQWVSPSPLACSNTELGDIVSVRVISTYRPLTPIVGQIIGSVSRSAYASMAIN